MKIKNACIVDADNMFIGFVSTYKGDTGLDKILGRTLKNNEQLIFHNILLLLNHSGAVKIGLKRQLQRKSKQLNQNSYHQLHPHKNK